MAPVAEAVGEVVALAVAADLLSLAANATAAACELLAASAGAADGIVADLRERL